MPASHQIALLAAFALTLIGLRYVCNLIAMHGGILAVLIVIVCALAVAEWLEPSPEPPPEQHRGPEP